MGKKKKLIDIDYVDVKKLVKKGKDITIKKEAEDAIVELFALQDTIKSAIDDLKVAVAKEALKLNPNFKSLKSDRVKVSYRTYGSRFNIDDSMVDVIPENLYKQHIKYHINTKELEKYVEENGSIPQGIQEREREQVMSIKIIED